jgi:hypothetical protein
MHFLARAEDGIQTGEIALANDPSDEAMLLDIVDGHEIAARPH